MTSEQVIGTNGMNVNGFGFCRFDFSMGADPELSLIRQGQVVSAARWLPKGECEHCCDDYGEDCLNYNCYHDCDDDCYDYDCVHDCDCEDSCEHGCGSACYEPNCQHDCDDDCYERDCYHDCDDDCNGELPIAGCDGLDRVAELRPVPAQTPAELVENVRDALADLSRRLPTDVYVLAGSSPRGDQLGGHLHFNDGESWDGYGHLVDQLDEHLLSLLLLISNPVEWKKRNRGYGRPGGYHYGYGDHVPHGGLEYRPPPSWLATPELAESVFAIGFLIADAQLNGFDFRFDAEHGQKKYCDCIAACNCRYCGDCRRTAHRCVDCDHCYGGNDDRYAVCMPGRCRCVLMILPCNCTCIEDEGPYYKCDKSHYRAKLEELAGELRRMPAYMALARPIERIVGWAKAGRIVVDSDRCVLDAWNLSSRGPGVVELPGGLVAGNDTNCRAIARSVGSVTSHSVYLYGLGRERGNKLAITGTDVVLSFVDSDVCRSDFGAAEGRREEIKIGLSWDVRQNIEKAARLVRRILEVI